MMKEESGRVESCETNWENRREMVRMKKEKHSARFDLLKTTILVIFKLKYIFMPNIPFINREKMILEEYILT